MCLEIKKTCECGREEVQLHMRDNIMSQEVILRVFCPHCSGNVAFDKETMLNDNDWMIEYDLETARFLAAAKLMIDPLKVGPEFLFDEGYASWREMYPGEQRDILDERKEIMAILKEDPQRYLEEIHRWNIARVDRLKRAGWRKARHA